jgi:hypothetical protein
LKARVAGSRDVRQGLSSEDPAGLSAESIAETTWSRIDKKTPRGETGAEPDGKASVVAEIIRELDLEARDGRKQTSIGEGEVIAGRNRAGLIALARGGTGCAAPNVR